MIRQAQIKLTLLYSAIFLLLFWSLSFGIYAWMDQFFGDQGRIHLIQINRNTPEDLHHVHREPPSDVVMDNLRNILITIDGILLISIPGITWFLTGNMLHPVQKAYNRERQFLTDASHELRTPLTILNTEMEISLKKEQTSTEYHKVMQSNKEEVEGLIALVENLLFMSREQTKHSSPINEKIDLTDLIVEQIANFQQRAKQKGLILTFRPPGRETLILGNQQLLKRLFTNLLDNGIKYTKKGSIITTIKQTKEHAIVTITDTGVGIPSSQQNKIFDRFYRADTSRTKQGYGLGLSIAKQIVAVHHGWIAVRSKPGKGTTLTLTFPLTNIT